MTASIIEFATLRRGFIRLEELSGTYRGCEQGLRPWVYHGRAMFEGNTKRKEFSEESHRRWFPFELLHV